MSQRLKAYRRFHEEDISKEDFIKLYSSGNAFVFAGREKDYLREYVSENKNILREKNKRRINENPVAAYSLKIKKQIQAVYARKQKSIGPKLFSILGCQAEDFIEYINAQLSDGMTPENYGKWQLDHIVPISSAKSLEDVDRLCHFTNYKPLWREENRKKGNKINTPSSGR